MDHPKRLRQRSVLLLTVLLLSLLLCGCGRSDETGYQTLDDLRGKKVAVVSGSVTEQMLIAHYGDDVEIFFYNSNADMAEALEAGKVDGYTACVIDAKLQCEVYTDQYCLPEAVDKLPVAFFFPQDADGDTLCAQMNEFIASEDVASIYQAWIDDPDAQSLPDTPLTAENGTLTLACSTTIGYPFCYVGSDGYMGYDIDLAYRFCRKYGYALELMDCDFGGMLGAVSAGKADFGGTHLAETPERDESVRFWATPSI